MQLQTSTHEVDSALNLIFIKGAQKLYNSYITTEKLPRHATIETQMCLHNSINPMLSKPASKGIIEQKRCDKVQGINADNISSKKVIIHKAFRSQAKSFKIKNQESQSTNYQTLHYSRKSRHDSDIIKDSSDFSGSKIKNQVENQQSKDQTNKQTGQRPSTEQVNRRKGFKISSINQSNTIEEAIDEKRAATSQQPREKHCHRIILLNTSNAKNQSNFQKIQHPQQEILSNSIAEQQARHERIDKLTAEKIKEEKIANQTNLLRRRKRVHEDQFQTLREKLGKNHEKIPLTNFQIDQSDHILINGVQKKSQSRVINLQFKTIECSNENARQSLVMGACRGKVKNDCGRLQTGKRIKLTNEEFNNNNERQVSSIPFMNLIYGMAYHEKGMEVSASRGRSPMQASRQDFLQKIQQNMFKSHLPGVTLTSFPTHPDTSHPSQFQTIQTARPSLKHTLESKEMFETTFQSRRAEEDSILWRPSTSRQTYKIKINNRDLASEEILGLKLKVN